MRIAVIFSVLIVGCGSGGAPVTTPDEEVVAEYLRRMAVVEGSVVIEKWGPHATDGVFWPPSNPGFMIIDVGPTPRPAKIIRVKFRSGNNDGTVGVSDSLAVVQDANVVAIEPNPNGDAWLRAYGRE